LAAILDDASVVISIALQHGSPAMTHDYIRHGTTTLFAALNVLDGTVIGQCRARHRHQEFIRFLNRIEAAVPAGKLVHAILDREGQSWVLNDGVRPLDEKLNGINRKKPRSRSPTFETIEQRLLQHNCVRILIGESRCW